MTPSEDIRLPGDLHPYHYDLRLRADFYERHTDNFKFNGTVKIFFTVKEGEKPSQIILHKKDMDPSNGRNLVVDEASLKLVCLTCSSGSEPIPVTAKEDPARQFYKVILTEGSLESGGNYSVEMSFEGDLLDDLHGWYYSSYTADDGTTR